MGLAMKKPSRPKASATRAKAATVLTVAAVMTPQPLTIGRRERLVTAHRMMRENGVRHLPVLEHGELIGVVSQRDLYFLETIKGVDVDADVVEDAMTTDVFAVPTETPIDAVARTMARKRYGCAVVMERGRVAGVFTATDALRTLAALTKPGPAERSSLGAET